MAEVHVRVRLNREFEFILDAEDEDQAEEAMLNSREVREKFADACLDAMAILGDTVYDEKEEEDHSGEEDEEETVG